MPMRVSMRAAGLTSDRALGPTWTPASKASLRPLRCKLIGALEIARVSDATQCGAGGWYDDDNTKASFINLCDATCAVVQADPTAKIQVFLGCLGS
jgi:hypothetical protein